MKRLLDSCSNNFRRDLSNSALAAGSVETGATKAIVCQACHGANGNSTNPEWPSLAGIGADYIAEQLKNFKEGKTHQSDHAAERSDLSRTTWLTWVLTSTAFDQHLLKPIVLLAARKSCRSKHPSQPCRPGSRSLRSAA